MRCRQEHISWGGAAEWHFGSGWAGTCATHKDSTSPWCLGGTRKVNIIERYISTATRLSPSSAPVRLLWCTAGKHCLKAETNWAEHRSTTSGLKNILQLQVTSYFPWERKHLLEEEGEITAALSSWKWKIKWTGGSSCLQEIKQEETDLNYAGKIAK